MDYWKDVPGLNEITDKAFVKLQQNIQKKMDELRILQKKYRDETGKDFIFGQPIKNK
jgi:hypothetical protein